MPPTRAACRYEEQRTASTASTSAVLQRVCDSEAAAAASSAAAAAVAGRRSHLFGADGLSGGGGSSRRSSAYLEALELEPGSGGNGGGDGSGVLRGAGGGAALLLKRPVELLSKLLDLLADAEANHRHVVLRPRAGSSLVFALPGATALINVWSTAIRVLVKLVIVPVGGRVLRRRAASRARAAPHALDLVRLEA